MNDLGNAIITAALTAFFGVFVYVAGQLIDKFFIEPLRGYRKTVGEIAVSIVLYANVSYHMVDLYIKGYGGYRESQEAGWELREERAKQIIDNEFRIVDEAVRTLRTLASELVSSANAIPLYGTWARFGVVPPIKDIDEAYRALIGFSNSITSGVDLAMVNWQAKIVRSLRIKVLIERAKS